MATKRHGAWSHEQWLRAEEFRAQLAAEDAAEVKSNIIREGGPMANRRFSGVRDLRVPTGSAGTFEAWMREVDATVSKLTGLGVDDLPDCCFRDWYEDDMTPASAARRAIRSAREA